MPENFPSSSVTDLVNKASNSINEVTQQTKTALTSTTEQAKETIISNTTQAVEQINNSTQQVSKTLWDATQNVKEVSHNAAKTISESAATAQNSISQVTNNAVTSVNEVTEKTKASLEETLQQAQAVNHALSQGIQTGIQSFVNSWMKDHPLLFWMISHPFYSLGIVLLAVLLLTGLFRAVSSLTVGFWVQILTAPFKLLTSFGKVTLGSGLWGFKRFSQPPAQSLSTQEKISQIFNRLEDIKQEQDHLLQELSTLLNPNYINPK